MNKRFISTPTGPIMIAASCGSITRVTWTNGPSSPEAAPAPDPQLDEAVQQLVSYFAGRRTIFDLPLALAGTVFQLAVWTEMTKIPYGETLTYGEIARSLGTAARAVGNACGANPIPIIIPCHRVTAANGKLGGFSGGAGGRTKTQLLALETGQTALFQA